MHFMSLLIVYVFFVLFFVWQHVRMTEIKYDIGKLKRNIAQEQGVVQKLKIRRAMLSSPVRIEKIARTKIGLRAPGIRDVSTIKAGESVKGHPYTEDDGQMKKEDGIIKRMVNWFKSI